tara:strand:- start:2033 stop:3457 length:1425 start_codon:yes stop_codon:yes gene_type:complete
MSNESIIKSLLGGSEFEDPRIYDALNLLLNDFYKVYYNIYPPESNRVLGETGSTTGADSVLGFTGTLFTNNLRLTWSALTGAASYELRYNFGASTNWDTATSLLTTSTLSADVNPLTVPLLYGNHTFLLKAITTLGVYSTTAASVVINIPQIAATVITPTVIDNNVLLKWTVPTSILEIDYYNVNKNGSLIGKMDGTFEVIFETSAGTFDYSVEAVDIVGNVGTSTTITVTVNQPPDYELTDSRSSTFNGTLNNCLLESDGKLYACIDLTATWNTHFSVPAYASPDAQVVAGFPLYIQPTLTTGYYEEVIDYGTVVNNTIITALYSSNELSASVAIVIKIATSLDNISYSAFTAGASLFASTLRYVKVKLEFTGADTDSLISIDSLQFRLDVKREIDSGTVAALAADTNGTAVTFGKAFKDIDSITLTVESKVPVTAFYRFVDIPNPTTFYVYCVDSTGNRVSYTVSWKARGIV